MDNTWLILILTVLVVVLCFIQQRQKSNSDHDNIGQLIRQSARWSVAASQDKSPIVAVLHANYGAGYLWAVKDLYTPDEIERATGLNFKTFERKVVSVQEKSSKRLAKLCPAYVGQVDRFLAAIAGEG